MARLRCTSAARLIARLSRWLTLARVIARPYRLGNKGALLSGVGLCRNQARIS